MSSIADLLSYSLPEDRIAQRPIWQRSHSTSRSDSRLLVAKTESESHIHIVDSFVRELPNFLGAGDVLVLNDTQVMPWRFFGKIERSGVEVELLLLEKRQEGENLNWLAMGRPLKRLKPGDRIFTSDNFAFEFINREGEDRILLKFEGNFEGVMPIPPYIRGGRGDELDEQAYQTVFAKIPGSVAAPTASLHLTSEILEFLIARGVQIATLTLHLGPGSFLPIRDLDIKNHQMSFEYFSVPEETQTSVAEARREGRRVVAVGTTVVRALESYFQRERFSANVFRVSDLPFGQNVNSEVYKTNLFITEGFQFEVVNALMTNFHQPGSTHLVLVAAFIGVEQACQVYRHALGAKDYRFLSYGDSSLLLRSHKNNGKR